MTRAHWKLWALSGFGVALDGFDLFIISVALPLIQKEFDTSAWQLGAVAAAAVFGAVVGALVFGPLTDRIGRKGMYAFDLVFFVVFAALSALAWNTWSLIAFRFLLGIGIGADYPISACYVSETMPTRLRGRLVGSTIGFFSLGMLFGALASLVLVLLLHDISAWRAMLALGVVPAVLVIFLRSTVPESPRWLQHRGAQTAMKHALAELTGEQPAGSPESGEGVASLALAAPPRVPLRTLFDKGLRRRLVLACVPWFLFDVAVYGVGLFTPTILMSLRFPSVGLSENAPFLAREITSAEAAAVLDLFPLLGLAIALLLIDRIGRVPLQIGGFLGMAVGFGVLAMAVSGTHTNLVFVFTGFMLFNILTNAGPGTTTYVLPSEIFPTALRGTAHGLASAGGKLGAVVGILLLPVLRAAIGLGPTLLLEGFVSLLAAVVTWLCRVEPSGRSLDNFEVVE
jgi:MFS family permease